MPSGRGGSTPLSSTNCPGGVILVGARDFGGFIMVYEEGKIYGPYTRKDGRQHIVVVYPDGTKRTVSYPKYLVEMYLNRYLDEDETVDHINGDVSDNSKENLQVIKRSDHVSLDVKRYKEKSFRCPLCNTEFKLSGRYLYGAILNRRRGKAGPFCSRSCAGSYSKGIQMGEKPIEIIEILPEYTTNKQLQSLLGETLEVEPAKTGKS